VPDDQAMAPAMPVLEDAWIGHHDQSDEDYYSQAGDLFRLMSEDQKQQLIGNIAGGLSQANESIQMRMIEQFSKADPDYGQRIKAALK
jgi:catalase